MPESGIPLDLIEDDVSDYAFVGDITEVNQYFSSYLILHFITHHQKQVVLKHEANILQNPYILASGITDNFDSANLTFNLTPSQYINLPHTVLDCPLSI